MGVVDFWYKYLIHTTESRDTRAEMMLDEKGIDMEGRVELGIVVQDERRGARDDVESENRRQLKCKLCK